MSGHHLFRAYPWHMSVGCWMGSPYTASGTSLLCPLPLLKRCGPWLRDKDSCRLWHHASETSTGGGHQGHSVILLLFLGFDWQFSLCWPFPEVLCGQKQTKRTFKRTLNVCHLYKETVPDFSAHFSILTTFRLWRSMEVSWLSERFSFIERKPTTCKGLSRLILILPLIVQGRTRFAGRHVDSENWSSRFHSCLVITGARQAPLSMAFPSKNAGVGCHFFLQGIFDNLDQTQVSYIGRWILYHWATREAPDLV